jgi:uncharacterized membrane protein
MSALSVPCPACHGENSHEAIFCVHCHKALGPYRYVREELQGAATPHELLADRVTDFIARPSFFIVHTLWFVIWVLGNAGVFAIVQRFDAYPYNLLSILLAVEAIFITGFLLISQNRQQRYLEKATELDYEVNVQAYREIQEVQVLLQEVLLRLERLENQ